jgi:hypothetical protein
MGERVAYNGVCRQHQRRYHRILFMSEHGICIITPYLLRRWYPFKWVLANTVSRRCALVVHSVGLGSYIVEYVVVLVLLYGFMRAGSISGTSRPCLGALLCCPQHSTWKTIVYYSSKKDLWAWLAT